MNRDNDVFQVLVTSGNEAVKAAGSSLEELADGEIGVFDNETNLTVDVTSMGTNGVPKGFYIVVNNGGTLSSSTGQFIQTKGLHTYTFRPHTAGQDMIVDIAMTRAECETDYTVKMNFNNAQIRRRIGYINFTKSFSVRTEDCVGDQTTVDANVVLQLLKDAIDADGSVGTELVAATAFDGVTPVLSQAYAIDDVISDEDDISAILTHNEENPGDEGYMKLRLTTSPQERYRSNDINMRYFYGRNTTIETSLVGGFDRTASVETVQNIAYEEGLGYDIKQKEYIAMGWNERGGDIYRVNTLTGLPVEMDYFIDEKEQYDQINLGYNFRSNAGWHEYESSLRTLIAIPAASDVTRDSLIPVLDVIAESRGFDALADDASASNVNPTVTEPTEDRTEDTDGIA